MSPFTELDSKCISSHAMATYPPWQLSWGDITLIVSHSLVDSKIAFYTTIFGRSLLLPTICLRCTPTSHLACTVHHSDTLSQNDLHPILIHRHQGPSPTTNDHKCPVSNPRIPSFPSTSSVPDPTRVLHDPHYVGTSSSPATFVTGQTLQTLRLTLSIYLQPTYLPLHITKIVHCGLLQVWSPCRDKRFLFILFLICLNI